MRIERSWLAGSLALALVAGGCSTLPTTRSRVVKAAPVCVDETVHIYFEEFSADVTPEGQAVLLQAAAQARGCTVRRVTVLGLADGVGGDPASNLELSKRRAQSVTAALTATGLPAADFELSAAGQDGAVNKQGDVRPLRRRADVTLHLEAPK